MKKLMMTVAVALTIAGMVADAKADERAWAWSPLGVGIAAPAQLPFTDSDIYGLRAGWALGINHDVYGIDCGAVEITRGAMYGIQASGFSWTSGEAIGFQFGLVANCVFEDALALQTGVVNADFGETSAGLVLGGFNYAIAFYGCQVAGLNWNNSTAAGLQIGIGNSDQEDFDGASFGGVNFARRYRGAQFGIFNYADELTGVQIGFINAVERIHGVQIGGINLITSSKLSTMVVMNAWF